MNSFMRNVYDCLIERGQAITIERVVAIITNLSDAEREDLEMAVSMCDEDVIAGIMEG